MNSWLIMPNGNGKDFFARNEKTGERLEIIQSPSLSNSPMSLGGQRNGYWIKDSMSHRDVARIVPDGCGGDRVETFGAKVGLGTDRVYGDLDMIQISQSIRELEK